MNIGDNIRKHRIGKEIKQIEMTERLGISQSTYSKIESNQCKIDINLLKMIAVILEVHISKLIDEASISDISSNDSLSEKLIVNLEERIGDLKKQVKLQKVENKYLKLEINRLSQILLIKTTKLYNLLFVFKIAYFSEILLNN